MIPKKLAQASQAAQLRWIRRNGRKAMDRELRGRVVRLLRRIQFGSELVSEQCSLCPACCAEPWIDLTGPEDLWRIEHKADCELAAVLQALEGER